MFIKLGSTESHIKFGGYDRRAIHDDSAFHIVQSSVQDRWKFVMTNATLAGVEMPVDRNVSFNPAVPWIYLPKKEFAEFSENFNKAWGQQKYKCDLTYGECRLNANCDTLRNNF